MSLYFNDFRKKARCFVAVIVFLSCALQAQTSRLGRDENNEYDYLAELYYKAGSEHCAFSRLDSALHYFELSLAMHRQAVDKGVGNQEKLDLLRINLFIGFAEINYYQGKYDLALNDFFKALELAEKINHPEKKAEVCYDVGETYAAMYNYQQAETYFLKAEQMYRAMNDSTGIADMYVRLSSVYILTENVPKGLEYAEEAYRILQEMPDAPLQIRLSAVMRLCDVWLMVPDFGKALEYSLKTVELARQDNAPPRSLAMYLCQLALCYQQLKRYSEAEETAFLSLATDSTDIWNNTQNYGTITLANIWLKNSKKAAKYFKMSLRATQALARENFQASISEMEVKYETEKKELQIAALKEEKRLMIWLSVAGGGLLLLGLLSSFFLWRLMVQKHRLAESHIIQLEQEKQLVATQAVFDGEVQERTRLARDLHDGLGGKLTCMKIYLQELKQNDRFDHAKVEQLDSAMNMLDDSVQELRRVSHNLMPDTLSRAGLKPAVDDLCHSMSSQIVFNYYGDETRIDLKLEAFIYRSIHELVNNALKYAGASQIMVQIVQEPDSIAFTVQDNGCGFDPSAGTKGTGLQGIRTRVASFGGDMQIDSNAEKGTEINVQLRISNYELRITNYE